MGGSGNNVRYKHDSCVRQYKISKLGEVSHVHLMLFFVRC